MKKGRLPTRRSNGKGAWPGTVRELENRIKRAVVMTEGKYVSPADLELSEPMAEAEAPSNLRASCETREKDLMRLALEKANGNVSRAAIALVIIRPTLYQLLTRYGLKKSQGWRVDGEGMSRSLIARVHVVKSFYRLRCFSDATHIS